jgi:hypothetical protein
MCKAYFLRSLPEIPSPSQELTVVTRTVDLDRKADIGPLPYLHAAELLFDLNWLILFAVKMPCILYKAKR